jgi:hypothetical protein
LEKVKPPLLLPMVKDVGGKSRAREGWLSNEDVLYLCENVDLDHLARCLLNAQLEGFVTYFHVWKHKLSEFKHANRRDFDNPLHMPRKTAKKPNQDLRAGIEWNAAAAAKNAQIRQELSERSSNRKLGRELQRLEEHMAAHQAIDDRTADRKRTRELNRQQEAAARAQINSGNEAPGGERILMHVKLLTKKTRAWTCARASEVTAVRDLNACRNASHAAQQIAACPAHAYLSPLGRGAKKSNTSARGSFAEPQAHRLIQHVHVTVNAAGALCSNRVW